MAVAKNNNGKAVKISKFEQILSASGQDVLDRRSQLAYKSAAKAMASKLQTLNDKRDELEVEMLNLTDLSVETKDSLRPTSSNFNPKEWVSKLCDYRFQIALLDDEIAIAEEVQAEYFSASVEPSTEA
jgi:hypothetical protein